MADIRTQLDQDILWFALADEIYDIYEKERKKQWFWWLRSTRVDRSDFITALHQATPKSSCIEEVFNNINANEVARKVNNAIMTQESTHKQDEFTRTLNEVCKKTAEYSKKQKQIDQTEPVVNAALSAIIDRDTNKHIIEPGFFNKLIPNTTPSSGKILGERANARSNSTAITIEENEKSALWKSESMLLKQINESNEASKKKEHIQTLLDKLEARWSYWGHKNTIQALIQQLKVMRSELCISSAMFQKKEELLKIVQNTTPQLYEELADLIIEPNNDLASLNESTVVEKMYEAILKNIDKNDWKITAFAMAKKIFESDPEAISTLELKLDHDKESNTLTFNSKYLISHACHHIPNTRALAGSPGGVTELQDTESSQINLSETSSKAANIALTLLNMYSNYNTSNEAAKKWKDKLTKVLATCDHENLLSLTNEIKLQSQSNDKRIPALNQLALYLSSLLDKIQLPNIEKRQLVIREQMIKSYNTFYGNLDSQYTAVYNKDYEDNHNNHANDKLNTLRSLLQKLNNQEIDDKDFNTAFDCLDEKLKDDEKTNIKEGYELNRKNKSQQPQVPPPKLNKNKGRSMLASNQHTFYSSTSRNAAEVPTYLKCLGY